MKKTPPVFSIALYAVAGLLILFSFWSLANCYSYINELMLTGGLTFAGSEFDIVSFYVSSCSPSFVYGLILITLGWMLQKKSSVPAAVVAVNTEVEKSAIVDKESKDENDDFDKWLNGEDKDAN